jgi:O-antigen/teichoic acid export membrane protein
VHHDGDFERFRRYLGAVGVVWVGACLVGALLVAAAPLALKAGTTDTFRSSLLILLAGAALQLFTGLAAARLAAEHLFRPPAIAYALGTGSSLVAFPFATAAFGVKGVAVALVAGYAISALVTASALRRIGWTPRPPIMRGSARRAGHLLLGAAAAISSQASLAISVSFASAASTGGATVYSYAVMAVLALNAGLASPVSVVYAPVVAREWDGRPDALIPLSLRAFRVGAIVAPTGIAALCLLGPAPAEAVLSRVSQADVHEIFKLVLIVSPTLVAAMLMMIPLVGVLGRGLVAPLAAGSSAAVAVHLALSALVGVLGLGLEGLAGVALISTALQAAVVLRLAFGERIGAYLREAARVSAQLIVPGALAFTAAGVLGNLDDFVSAALAWVIGAVVTFAWLRWRHATELVDFLSLVPRPTSRGGARP